jgi:glycosyltransferase involved in cell wall biosynthesis
LDADLGMRAQARLVLHILPYDLARGAQRYARALVDYLDPGRERHRILTLFAAEPVLLEPDYELNVPRGGLRKLGVDPRAVIRLRKTLREVQPAALVAHGGEPAKYAALAAQDDLPIAYLSIGSAHPNLRRPTSRYFHRMYTRRADVVVAVSSDVAREAQTTHGLSADRIVVIPNGRDAALFRPMEIRREGPVRLIFIGHLDDGKRPEIFIRMVEALSSRGLDVEARIVGEGHRGPELEPAATGAGVAMLGRRDDVPELLADSDILILTSRPPEGMPGVLIEAGLTGLASVSTRIPGAADVIDDGVTGMLVDVFDFDALVDAVERLVNHEALRTDMGRRARERCLDRFTLEATAERWQRLLDEITGRPPVRP